MLKKYPAARYDDPAFAVSAVATDTGFACPTHELRTLLAKHTTVYAFEFADPAPPPGERDGFPLGAYHTADVQYLFGYTPFQGAFTPEQQALSDEMIAYWAAFAASGDPAVAGAPNWPRYKNATKRVLELRAGREPHDPQLRRLPQVPLLEEAELTRGQIGPGPGLEPERDAAEPLEMGRRDRDVLRHRVRVAPAALERAAERDRVHARGVAHEVDRAREALRGGDVGEAQPHLIVDARRRAGPDAREHLARHGRDVRARAVDEAARARDVDLHARALAQRARARDRHLLGARARELVDRAPRDADADARDRRAEPREQRQRRERIERPRLGAEELEAARGGDVDVVHLDVVAARAREPVRAPGVEHARLAGREERAHDHGRPVCVIRGRAPSPSNTSPPAISQLLCVTPLA